MEGILIRCLLDGEIHEYLYAHQEYGREAAEYLFDITFGMVKTKIKEFRFRKKEDNLMDLAHYFVSNDIKITRIKPVGSDWSVAKQLMGNIHHLRIRNAVR